MASSAAFAGSSVVQPKENPYYIAGPAVVTDSLNGISFDLPKGWYASIPEPVKGIPMTGVTTIANYDLGHAENLMPGRSAHEMLPGMVKADLFTQKLEAGMTVAQFAGERNHNIVSGTYDELGTEIFAPALTTSTIRLRFAGEDGYAYGVVTELVSSVDLILPWKSGSQIFFANVHQADSRSIDQAMLVLDTVRPAGERPRPILKSQYAEVVAPVLKLVTTEVPALQQAVASAGACTSWTGSDAGTGISNCPDTLYFPVQYNEYWEAGNAGSFWGNYYHGNCNNDYYAMDLNYRGVGSCGAYGNDIGHNAYAAYSGTAAQGAYDSTGYGYHTIVTSTISGVTYKTYYAHLKQTGYAGAATANVTVVGLVGDSGAAAGAAHLHFGIKQSGSSKCNTNGSNASCTTKCSNCEAKASPQSCKPGRMSALGGIKSMYDGACYGGPP